MIDKSKKEVLASDMFHYYSIFRFATDV